MRSSLSVRCTVLFAVFGLVLTGCTRRRHGPADEVTAHKAHLHGAVLSTRDETGSVSGLTSPAWASRTEAVPLASHGGVHHQTQIPVSLTPERPRARDRLQVPRLLQATRDAAHPVPPGCGETKFFSTPAAPSAAVSLGDSYISGEAGRWEGNSINPGPAATAPTARTSASARSTTRASSTTRPRYATVPPLRRGRDTRAPRSPWPRDQPRLLRGGDQEHLPRLQGGEAQQGEPPQADQLATGGPGQGREGVVLSIGGNDSGSPRRHRLRRGLRHQHHPAARRRRAPGLAAKFPATQAARGQGHRRDARRHGHAGYLPSSWRLVLQSYPSAIARASELRVPELNKASRTAVDGCPVYDSDADWARDTVVGQISDGLAAWPPIAGSGSWICATCSRAARSARRPPAWPRPCRVRRLPRATGPGS